MPKASPPVLAVQTTHIVERGETLWSIAEKYYGSGYNWTLIAKANNIAHPGMIFKDNKLIIPQAPKLEPTQGAATGEITPHAVSTVKSYTVIKGDTLWDISVKAYGDGYGWTKIAEANHLMNPRMIHPGNTLSIP
jgi:nucleoid-associated protein YgaU